MASVGLGEVRGGLVPFAEGGTTVGHDGGDGELGGWSGFHGVEADFPPRHATHFQLLSAHKKEVYMSMATFFHPEPKPRLGSHNHWSLQPSPCILRRGGGRPSEEAAVASRW